MGNERNSRAPSTPLTPNSVNSLLDAKPLKTSSRPIVNPNSVNASELAKIPYLSQEAAAKRHNVDILPYWDGERWYCWIPHNGSLMTLHPMDAVETDYVGKSAQREDDLLIPFVEFMWQRGNFTHVNRYFRAICEDFHNLFTSVAKLKALHSMKQTKSVQIPSSFISTEIEYMLTVSRSIFDLLYKTIREIWERTTLVETSAFPERKLPKKFSEFVLEGDKRKPRTVESILNKHQVPPGFAAAVVRHADFFTRIRSLRDSIIHDTGPAPTFFVLDGGYGVSPKALPFAHFPWRESHYFNDDVVSLLPWIADLVLQTIEVCNNIMFSFAQEVSFPPELAPGNHVFVRCQTSEAVLDLLAAHHNKLVWWSR